MARLRHAGREGSALDGVSPALRAGASDFSLRGQRKVTNRAATPAKPPACGGFPHLALWVGRNAADGPSSFAIHGSGQSPLRTSVFSRQIGSSCARPFRFCPCPSAARSASCLAAWTRGLASANQRGIKTVPALSFCLNRRYAPSPPGRGLG